MSELHLQAQGKEHFSQFEQWLFFALLLVLRCPDDSQDNPLQIKLQHDVILFFIR